MPLTVKELIKSGVNVNGLKSDNDNSDEEFDKESENDVDSNLEAEFVLDMDDGESNLVVE